MTLRTTKRSLSCAAAVLAVGLLLLAGCSGGPTTNPVTPGTITIKYGPFNVPGANEPMEGAFSAFATLVGGQAENGMIWNQPATDVKKPCENCYITSMNAGLEYVNGGNANISTGMWLHHMVLLDQGTNTWDATCRNSPFSLPHFAVGGSGSSTERIFASGNERTVFDLSKANGTYGYKVNTGDKFHLLVDLMNMNVARTPVYLTMTYKYTPANTAGIHNVKPVWLDVAQCGTSEATARTGSYDLVSAPWASNVAGPLLGVGGHLHDGGVNALIKKNGATICDSQMQYGTKPEFIEPGGMAHSDGDDHSMGGMQHISEVNICWNPTTVAMNDNLTVTGHYDDSLHQQMTHGGRLHQVMAIAIAYVGQ